VTGRPFFNSGGFVEERADASARGTTGRASDARRTAADSSPKQIARWSSAVRDSLAVGLATAVYGISFGALAVAAGLDVWQTCFLSLVMFTGGSQFALVGVLASGGVAAGGSAIATAAMLGIRNVVYGMRMKPIVDDGRLSRRVAAAWITIDESTAVALAQTNDRAARVGFWLTGLVIFVGWNLTTLAGALIGDALGDTRAWGLDAAAAAAFLGLLWPRLKNLQAGAVAVAAAVVATLTTPVLMPGLPVLVAALVAVAVGWFDLAGRRRSA
jgi:predicted branched-subunit amino acid permease